MPKHNGAAVVRVLAVRRASRGTAGSAARRALGFVGAFSLVWGISLAAPMRGQVWTGLDSSRVFSLGEVTVVGSRTRTVPEMLSVHLSPRQFESMGRRDLGDALPLAAGVVLQRIGPRNEAGVRLRGFDLRHVPLYVDGIPVYVPYDGFVDLARFLTTDVARITLERGFSSLLYGPNGMAGAVNVITRVPSSRIEGRARVGWHSPRGRELSLHLGTRAGRWFAIGNVAYVEQPSFTLASSFEPAPAEDGGRRDNADRKDTRVSARLGFVPRAGTTVALGYLMQGGVKGNPPYAGSADDVRVRYWRWPLVDKESVYVLADHMLSDAVHIRVRGYYDWFDSSLFSYDDATYSTQERPYAFRQKNDDEAFGGSVVLSVTSLRRHKIALASHVKRDGHDEYDGLQHAGQYRDVTWSVAIEDEMDMGRRSKVSAGISYDRRQSLAAERFDLQESFPVNANGHLSGHIAVVKDVAGRGHAYLSVGSRTRFPTIKDRYSFREGRAVPNPGLAAERAFHVEIGAERDMSASIRVRAALFATSVGDVIQAVEVVEPESGRTLAQLQHTPSHVARLNIQGDIHRLVSLAGRLEYAGPLYSRVEGTTLTKLGGYARIDFEAVLQVWQKTRASVGVQNVLDADYEIVAGYPEAGRAVFLRTAFVFGR
jgi:iron complex outermembrane receptor protein